MSQLAYPENSLSAFLLEKTADLKTTALLFEGRKISYPAFWADIQKTAAGLASLGVKKGVRVMITLPNCPQAAVLFYAINYLGGVAVMAHPLLSAKELAKRIKETNCGILCTLDLLADKWKPHLQDTPLTHFVVTKLSDALPFPKNLVFAATKERKADKVPLPLAIQRVSYGSLLANAPLKAPVAVTGEETAVILFSGGTTGVPKGILLTNKNFNALAMQTAAAGDCIREGHLMLAILPLFHGFGLGVCLHTALISRCQVLLMPKFSPAAFEKAIKKAKPHYIAGVPTMYEALLRLDGLEETDLSFLEGVFCGGDSLSPSLKGRIDDFLQAHGANVQIREGYGTTECVTASCLTPKEESRVGSIGLPFPDTLYCICRPGSTCHLPAGEAGEICLSGPTVMKGYENFEEETKKVLQKHPDGRIYLHTGDLGKMDKEGYVYFLQRLKRVIISSGYNIYPSHLEEILDAHPHVQMSAVIGVPDPYQQEKVKAFLVLKDGFTPDEAEKEAILAYCKEEMAKYELPREIVFRSELPKTVVGKVDVLQLLKESGAENV